MGESHEKIPFRSEAELRLWAKAGGGGGRGGCYIAEIEINIPEELGNQ